MGPPLQAGNQAFGTPSAIYRITIPAGEVNSMKENMDPTLETILDREIQHLEKLQNEALLRLNSLQAERDELTNRIVERRGALSVLRSLRTASGQSRD